MKKHLRNIGIILFAFALCTSAFATEVAQKGEHVIYAIIVNNQPLDLSNLPLAPYKEDNTVMVPLRIIGEALGYNVDWNAESKAISIDDEYIQKATLYEGTATVYFEGRLQSIVMDREIENSAKTVIHSGFTYVPMEFFEEFFNDVTIESTIIRIAPSKSELHNTMDLG